MGLRYGDDGGYGEDWKRVAGGMKGERCVYGPYPRYGVGSKAEGV